MSDRSIRQATQSDVDALVELTLPEAAEADGLTLTVEGATVGVRGAFTSPPSSTYWVVVDDEGRVLDPALALGRWASGRPGRRVSLSSS